MVVDDVRVPIVYVSARIVRCYQFFLWVTPSRVSLCFVNSFLPLLDSNFIYCFLNFFRVCAWLYVCEPSNVGFGPVHVLLHCSVLLPNFRSSRRSSALQEGSHFAACILDLCIHSRSLESFEKSVEPAGRFFPKALTLGWHLLSCRLLRRVASRISSKNSPGLNPGLELYCSWFFSVPLQFHVYVIATKEAHLREMMIPGLPDDLSMLCIARVPRAHHHNMTSVCRGWRDFVHGRQFSELRRKLSVVEDWLYVWTQFGNAWRCFDPSTRKWMKLPSLPQDDNRVGGYSAFASFDGKLFVIGGYLWSFYSVDHSYIPCRTVPYFDPRSGSWKRAADLNVARAKCMTGIIDNRLYVFGGYLEGFDNDFVTITGEFYDPDTNSWTFISNMRPRLDIYDSVVMERKMYALSLQTNGAVYDAQTDRWAPMPRGLRRRWDDTKIVVLNGMLYTILDSFHMGILEVGNVRQEERVRMYNPSKDAWELVRDIDHSLWGFLKSEFVEEMELVNLDGRLCIISVENSPMGSRNIVLRTAIFEVKTFTKVQTCVRRVKHIKRVRAAHECPDAVLTDIKTCQVVAL